jgi:hypothetical protein
MTKDEALDLALEALEDLQRQYSIYPNSFWDWSKGRKAITAIKQARSAPVQSCYCPNCEAMGKELAALKAQPAPVQEPVAWMHVMDNTEGIKANGKGIVSITQKQKHPFGKPGVDFSKSFPVTSTPLYTTPPAAQPAVPLTDEQIYAIGKELGMKCRFDGNPNIDLDYARAIEASHGITKGQP